MSPNLSASRETLLIKYLTYVIQRPWNISFTWLTRPIGRADITYAQRLIENTFVLCSCVFNSTTFLFPFSVVDRLACEPDRKLPNRSNVCQSVRREESVCWPWIILIKSFKPLTQRDHNNSAKKKGLRHNEDDLLCAKKSVAWREREWEREQKIGGSDKNTLQTASFRQTFAQYLEHTTIIKPYISSPIPL